MKDFYFNVVITFISHHSKQSKQKSKNLKCLSDTIDLTKSSVKSSKRGSLVMASLILVCLLLLFSRCDNTETCHKCSVGRIHSTFNSKYIRLVRTTLEGTASFFEYDTVKNLTMEYKICSTDQFKSLEERKIVKASGKIFYPCTDDSLKLIEIENYEVISYCTGALKMVDGDFSLLDRTWYIYSVSNPDTILYVPCESSNLEPYILFDDNSIRGLACTNDFLCNYLPQGTNEIKLSGCSNSLFTGTQADMLFENLFGMTIQENSLLNYTLENNILIIQNPLNNSSLKLYAK